MILDLTTPLFDQTVKATHIDPDAVWSAPAQPYRLYGHKKRKALARDASRVLANEGFAQ